MKCLLCGYKILKSEIFSDKVGLFKMRVGVPFSALVHERCFEQVKKAKVYKYRDAIYEKIE